MKFFKPIFFFAFFYILACQDEEILPRQYPVVNTLEVTEINTLGAVFNAEITSGQINDIIEHGFVWSADKSNPVTFEKGNLTRLGKPTETIFSVTINSLLLGNKEYRVRSYVVTKDKIIYGQIVSFTSLGSQGPFLTSAIPAEARVRDTVTLVGRNFSYKVSDNLVRIDNQDTKVLSATDTSLKVIVPDIIFNTKPNITLDLLVNKTSSNTILKIKTPEILSVTPETGVLCDTIAILGNNFFPDIETNRVFFGSKKAKVLSVKKNRTEIKLLAPYLPENVDSIRLVSGSFEKKSKIRFTQTLPKVIGDAVLENSVLTISGTDFPDCYTDAVIRVGSCTSSNCNWFLSDLISLTKTKIELKIPQAVGCLASSLYVRFETGDSVLYVTKSINFKAAKVLSLAQPSATFGEEVKLNVQNFDEVSFRNLSINVAGQNVQIVTKSQSEIIFKLPAGVVADENGMMDVQINFCQETVMLNDALALKVPVIFDFSPKEINSKSDQLVITGDNFNPLENRVNVGDRQLSSTKITSSKSQIIIPNASEIIGDIYLTQSADLQLSVSTGGLKATASVPLKLNYKSMWTKLADLPFYGTGGPASFALNGKAYIISGLTPIGLTKEVWEFDMVSGVWTRKSDFPGDGMVSPEVIVINNKAYIGLSRLSYSGVYNEWWEFNPVTDNWIKKADFPGGASGGSFVIDNTVFVVGAYDSNSGFTSFWQYNPSSNEWFERKKIVGEVYPLMYSINGKGHIYTISEGTNRHLSYDPLTDQWSEFDQNIPSFVNYAHFLSSGSSVYILYYGNTYSSNGILSFYEFKPLTNSLTVLAYRGLRRTSPIFFKSNNEIYLGSGRLDGFPTNNYLIDFWKIDLTKVNP